VLASYKFVLNLCLCNKVPYIINGVLLLLPTLYLYFRYVFVSTCCVEKIYRKTSVGETHHDIKMGFDRENHKIWEVMDQGPHMMKPRADPTVGRPTSSMGPRPTIAPPSLVLRLRLGLSPIHSIFTCFIFRSEPN
jgi:hypothetical protein